MTQEARQQCLEDGSVSLETFVEVCCVSVLQVKPRCCIKSFTWRGLASLLRISEEGAEHEVRIKDKFKEWHAHWKDGQKGPKTRKAVGKHGAEKRRTIGSSKGGCAHECSCGLCEYHRSRLTLLQVMEMAGLWSTCPTNAVTTFFLISNSTTSERPIALLPALIRWWKWLRGPVVVEWTGRQTVTWDTCSKCVGGVERAGWETLLEMEHWTSRGARQVLEPLCWWWNQRRPIRCGLGMDHIFGLSTRVPMVLCGYFAHERRVMFGNLVPEPTVTIAVILLGFKWSMLL